MGISTVLPNAGAVIPWRVKNVFSRTFPLLTHLALNLGRDHRSPDYWDRELEEDWDNNRRSWPAKHRMIEARTDRNDAILDVGCGTGHLLRHLRDAGYRNICGLDISGYAVRRLSEQEGVSAVRGALPVVPIPDRQFDIVVASQVLEHIIQRKKFLREVFRVLKPGGRFFCYVPHDCLDPLAEPSHVALYTAPKLRRLLDGFGNVVEVDIMVDDNHPMEVLYAVVVKPTKSCRKRPRRRPAVRSA